MHTTAAGEAHMFRDGRARRSKQQSTGKEEGWQEGPVGVAETGWRRVWSLHALLAAAAAPAVESRWPRTSHPCCFCGRSPRHASRLCLLWSGVGGYDDDAGRTLPLRLELTGWLAQKVASLDFERDRRDFLLPNHAGYYRSFLG